MTMKIKKVFNNNVVLTEDSHQVEMVVMGRGLAFQKRIGDLIDTENVEKMFITPSEGFANKLSELLEEIPYEIMTLSKDIIEMANRELHTDLNESLYLSLSDHIHFAVTRIKNGLPIKNALMWEVQKFYKSEYQVARKALEMIKERTGESLPEDETASLALHFFNARQDGSGIEETMAMTNIVNDVTNIVKYHYGIDFDEESMNYSRFITHLRYFAYRMLRGELNDDPNDALYEQVKMQYPVAYECTKKVQTYLNKQYQMVMTKDELAYFMIHIQRVSSREKS
jgi:beta-glucoside operon transcriptional antiterminator